MGTARERMLLKKPSIRTVFTKFEAGSILKILQISYHVILKLLKPMPLGLESIVDGQHTNGDVGYVAQKLWI